MFFNKKIFDKDALDMIANASTIGLHLVSGTFVGLAMGYFLDQWLVVTKPWLTIAFLIFGIVAGFRNVWQDTKKIQRAHDAETYEKPAPEPKDKTGGPGGKDVRKDSSQDRR